MIEEPHKVLLMFKGRWKSEKKKSLKGRNKQPFSKLWSLRYKRYENTIFSQGIRCSNVSASEYNKRILITKNQY